MTLFGLLEEHVRQGTLNVQLPDGTRRRFGSGQPEASIVFTDPATIRRIAYDPGFEFGQTYMEGAWKPGDEGLRALLQVTMSNFAEMFDQQRRRPLNMVLKLLQQGNRIRRAYRNVSHHYDLDEWLFRRFLDRGMFYSCAYFERPDMTLEEAQIAKCRQIALKLRLEPGLRVLDIGSGWGGLAMYLASEFGVSVDGLTVSQEQLRVARKECTRRGLDDRVAFHFRDYREHQGRYDRIVSVGMFEHVGQPYYTAFFRQLSDLLKEDGVATAAHHRAQQRAVHDQRLVAPVHLPGRLHPCPVRTLCGAGAGTPDDHRPGGLAPALRADPGGVVPALPIGAGRGCRALRRALLQDVGVLSGVLRRHVPILGPGRVPLTDGEAARRGADHAGLPVP
jgi:2-polyprenyl-3-methyl-5-hydroxy-6-metoxy-1,4-benzoquinol methylase